MNQISNVTRIHRATGHCRDCQRQQLCLGRGIDAGQAEQLNGVVQVRRSLTRGALLARQGDSASHVFAIRTGTVKRVARDADGTERVVGFAYPGDVVGLDALGAGRHAVDIVALDTVGICMLPARSLLELAQRTPSLLQELLRAASAEIRAAEYRGCLIADIPADERLRVFLCQLAERNAARGLSPHELVLAMSRKDIASYLSMAVETVSRLLHKLQQCRAISVEGRRISLHADFGGTPQPLHRNVA